MKSVIIDDDLQAIYELSNYLSHIPSIKIVATFDNPLEALSFLNLSEDIDLIFTDVDMPWLNGIELADLIRARTNKLVFTTSHSKYALDAFKVNADDFLLKPFSLADVIKTLDKIFPNQAALSTARMSTADFLYIKSKEENLKLIKVDFDDIIAIESLLNYIRIHTTNGKYITHMSLKDAKKVFQDRYDFIQLHRSFIISKKHISTIQGNMLTMTSGAKFTSGESYREQLNSFLEEKVLKPIAKTSAAQNLD